MAEAIIPLRLTHLANRIVWQTPNVLSTGRFNVETLTASATAVPSGQRANRFDSVDNSRRRRSRGMLPSNCIGIAVRIRRSKSGMPSSWIYSLFGIISILRFRSLSVLLQELCESDRHFYSHDEEWGPSDWTSNLLGIDSII